MKKEFLLELGLAEDTAAKIMDENGKDIQNVDRKLTAMTGERDTLKTQFGEVQEKLKAFDGVDVENLKGEIAKLSGDLQTTKDTHAKELALRDRRAETDKFMSALKFVNDETREFYLNKLEAALDDDANKGKNRKDLVDALVNGEDGKPRPNIFAEEKQIPPPYATGTGSSPMLKMPDDALKQALGLK